MSRNEVPEGRKELYQKRSHLEGNYAWLKTYILRYKTERQLCEEKVDSTIFSSRALDYHSNEKRSMGRPHN